MLRLYTWNLEKHLLHHNIKYSQEGSRSKSPEYSNNRLIKETHRSSGAPTAEDGGRRDFQTLFHFQFSKFGWNDCQRALKQG